MTRDLPRNPRGSRSPEPTTGGGHAVVRREPVNRRRHTHDPPRPGHCHPGQVDGGRCATAALRAIPPGVIETHSRRRPLVKTAAVPTTADCPTTCPNCCHQSDGHHHCRPTIPTTRGAPFLPLPAHRMGSHARGAATHWPCRSQGARPEPQPGGQPSTSTGHHGGTGCSGRRAVRPPVQGSHRAQRRTPGHDAG
jgi:hypothetical protein